MYVTSYDELAREIDHRREHREEIRASMNAFAKARYGVRDMHSLVARHIPFQEDGFPAAVLARQIASVCAEDVAFELGARRLACAPLVLTFTRDSFTKNNHDKLHRVKVPWIEWSKKGNLVLEFERLSPCSNDQLEAIPLDRIGTVTAVSLPEHHLALRAAAGMRGEVKDVFPLTSTMLHRATNRPEFVYREIEERERRISVSATDPLENRDRPPASWYYPYYLSWFLDGTLVLFETYDNPLGDVAHAKSLFERTMQDVTIATGYSPLVVKVPPLSKDMLYCNRHLLGCANAWERLEEVTSGTCMDDTVTFFRTIAEAAIAFR
ncbi:MAG: hypothetical protein ACM3TU_01350 [Bacillota bacterium]